MELTGPRRSRISRDTRLLLMTIGIAVAALWVLARLRFPDRPVTANPIPPLLTQIAPSAALEDLATQVSQLQPRLLPLFRSIGGAEPDDAGGAGAPPRPALRIHPDVAVVMLDREAGRRAAEPLIVASDPASGLAVVRVAAAPAPVLTLWPPAALASPRYLVASDASRVGISLRPVFVGALHPMASPLFAVPIWAAPASSGLAAGTFVFTLDAAFVGLVIDQQGAPAIVPAAAMIELADRLLQPRNAERRTPGQLGVEVQALIPSAAAAATSPGVLVTWVDPKGPAAGHLEVFDIIELVDSEAMVTTQYWRAHLSRVADGDAVTLRVRRRGATDDVQLIARAAAPRATGTAALGLTLRPARGGGVEVVRVARDSVADRAGVEPGDVITLIGETRAMTAAQVTRAYAAAPPDGPLLVAITRGDAHRVVGLEKQ